MRVGIHVDGTAGRDQRVVADARRDRGMDVDEVEVHRHADRTTRHADDDRTHVDRRIRRDGKTLDRAGLPDLGTVGHTGARIATHIEVDPGRADGQAAAGRSADIEAEALVADRGHRDRAGVNHHAAERRVIRAGVVDHHHGGADRTDPTGHRERVHIDQFVHAAGDGQGTARRNRARRRRRHVGGDVEHVDARSHTDGAHTDSTADDIDIEVFAGVHTEPVTRIDDGAGGDGRGADNRRRCSDLALDVEQGAADGTRAHLRRHVALRCVDLRRGRTGLFLVDRADAADTLVAGIDALGLRVVVDAHLVVRVAVGRLLVALQRVVIGASARVVRIGVILVEHGTDVPHRNRPGQTGEAACAADREAVHRLDLGSIDGDVVLRSDARTEVDARCRVVVQAAHVHRAADADEAPRHRQHEGLDRRLVARDHDGVLRAVGQAVGIPVDIGIVDRGLGLGADEVYRERTRCSDEATATGNRQVEQVFARTRFDDHAVCVGRAEHTTGRAAIAHAEAGTVTERGHVSTVGNQRRRVLVHHHHAHACAHAHVAHAEATVDQHDLGVVSRPHEGVPACPHLPGDGRVGVTIQRQHVDAAADAHGATGDAHPHQQDVFGGLADHRHVVGRAHHGARADAGTGVVVRHGDVDRRRHRGAARDRQAGRSRRVAEVVRRHHQHLLATIGRQREARRIIHTRICADASVRRRVDDVDRRCDRHRRTARTREADGIGFDVVRRRGRDDHAACGGHACSEVHVACQLVVADAARLTLDGGRAVACGNRRGRVDLALAGQRARALGRRAVGLDAGSVGVAATVVVVLLCWRRCGRVQVEVACRRLQRRGAIAADPGPLTDEGGGRLVRHGDAATERDGRRATDGGRADHLVDFGQVIGIGAHRAVRMHIAVAQARAALGADEGLGRVVDDVDARVCCRAYAAAKRDACGDRGDVQRRIGCHVDIASDIGRDARVDVGLGGLRDRAHVDTHTHADAARQRQGAGDRDHRRVVIRRDPQVRCTGARGRGDGGAGADSRGRDLGEHVHGGGARHRDVAAATACRSDGDQLLARIGLDAHAVGTAGGDVRVVAHIGFDGVGVHQGRIARPDTDLAAGTDGRCNELDVERAGGIDRNVLAGVDVGAVGNDVVFDVGTRLGVDDLHCSRGANAHVATADAGIRRDRDEVFARRCGDRHVAAHVDVGTPADVGLGVFVDDREIEAGADAHAVKADRHAACDRGPVKRVGRRHAE